MGLNVDEALVNNFDIARSRLQYLKRTSTTYLKSQQKPSPRAGAQVVQRR